MGTCAEHNVCIVLIFTYTYIKCHGISKLFDNVLRGMPIIHSNLHLLENMIQIECL